MNNYQIKLKNDIIMYKVYEFKGRKVVVAAVKGTDKDFDINFDHNTIILGVAICHPNDDFDEIRGANIASRNAHKDPKAFYVASFSEAFSIDLLNIIIDNEMYFVRKNPNLFIKGYNKIISNKIKSNKETNISNE